MRRRRKGTLSNLANKLDILCGRIVKARDGNCCQHCGKPVEGCNAHCAHIVPRSNGLVLRWDLLNMITLCFHCHINWSHKSPVEFAEWFQQAFPARWQYLSRHKNEIVKLRESDREQLLAELEQKLKEFKK